MWSCLQLRQAFERFPSMRKRVAGAAKVLAAEPTRHLQLQLESQRLLAHGVYIPFLRWTPPASQVRGTAGKEGWVQAGAGAESDSDSSEDGVPVRDVTRPTASTLAKRHDAPPDRSTRRAGVMEDFRTLTPQVGDGDEGIGAPRPVDAYGKPKRAGKGGAAASRGNLPKSRSAVRSNAGLMNGSGGGSGDGGGGRDGSKHRAAGSKVYGSPEDHRRRRQGGIAADGQPLAPTRTLVKGLQPAYRTGERQSERKETHRTGAGPLGSRGAWASGDAGVDAEAKSKASDGDLQDVSWRGRTGRASSSALHNHDHSTTSVGTYGDHRGHRVGASDVIPEGDGPVYVTRGGPSSAWA